MKRVYCLLLALVLGAVSFSGRVGADEVVIENRGERTFYYALRPRDGSAWSQTYEVAPGEKQSHPASQRLKISYLSDDAQFAWLEPNRSYRISDVTHGRLRAVTEVRRPNVSEENSASAASSSNSELPAPSTATAEPSSTRGEPGAAPASPTTPVEPSAPTAPAASSLPPAAIPAPPATTAGTSPSATSPMTNAADDAFDGLFDITNRVVTVRAIADNTYRNAFPQWRERVRGIIEGASEYYQREYSIRLVLAETQAWEYDAVSDDLETRWSRLLELSPGGVDLIVAMVGFGEYSNVEGEATLTGQLGRAAFFGQHLMVADRQDYHVNRAKTILMHELGHVFGAFHVADQNLLMYPGYLQLPTEAIIAGTVPLGATNDQVFAMTKDFVFREGVAGLAPATQRRIQTLFHQYGLSTESRQTDPVTSGYEYLERRAKIVAKQMAERALTARGAFDALAD